MEITNGRLQNSQNVRSVEPVDIYVEFLFVCVHVEKIALTPTNIWETYKYILVTSSITYFLLLFFTFGETKVSDVRLFNWEDPENKFNRRTGGT